MPRSTVESVFKSSNSDRRKDRGLGGDDMDENSLCFYEFIEATIALADSTLSMDVEEVSGLRRGPCGALEKLIADRIVPLSEKLGYATARAVLKSRPLVLLVSSSLGALRRVFDYYAVPASDMKGRRRVAAIARLASSGGSNAAHGHSGSSAAAAAAAAAVLIPKEIIINASRATVDCTGALGGEAVTRTPQWVELLNAAAAAAARRGVHGQLPPLPPPPADASVPVLSLESFTELLAHAGLFRSLAHGAAVAAPLPIDISRKKPTGGSTPSVVYPAPGSLTARDVARSYWGVLGVPTIATPTPAGLTLAGFVEALAWISMTKWGPQAGLSGAWMVELSNDDAETWRASAALKGGAAHPVPQAALPELCRTFLEWAVESITFLGDSLGTAIIPGGGDHDAVAAAEKARATAEDPLAVHRGGGGGAETVLLDYLIKKKTQLPGGRVLAQGPSSPVSNFRGDANVQARKTKARLPLPFTV